MISLFQQNAPALLNGFLVTIAASLIALVASLALGTTAALMQTCENKLANKVADGYVELFRNLPLLIITMFFYVVVPAYFPLKLDGFTAGTIGLSLYTSSFIAETVRAGIQSLGAGQMEGARANGLTYWQAMRFIILPQAFKLIIPPLGNQFINMIKNSSVLSFVAGVDLMYQGQLVASTTFQTTNTYIIVGLFYLCLTLPVSYTMRHIEKKLAK